MEVEACYFFPHVLHLLKTSMSSSQSVELFEPIPEQDDS